MFSATHRVLIFDTTMRDGEMMPGVVMNVNDKIQLAQLLEAAGVDIIEVSYPGQLAKDFQEISAIAPLIRQATICGLASSQEADIMRVVEGLQKAHQKRIHIYTNVGLKGSINQSQTLETIRASVALARNYCDDVEWSAFDATRCELDFLCRTVEIAIANSATTINIPDSLGKATPEAFTQLLENLFNRVSHLDQVILSVHCHNDLGMAVANSLAALEVGTRQIECALKGLGARKGNAALEEIVAELDQNSKYTVNLDRSLLQQALKLVEEILQNGVSSENL